MSYQIFTDTSSGLPKAITSLYNINIIPLTCIADGELLEIKCDDEEFLKDFYKRLRDKNTMSTSCINEQTFYDKFKTTLEKGEDLIYIGLSSGLSNTIENATNAKVRLEKEFKDRKIYIVDSLNAALGEGLIVYTACLLREEGKSIEDTYNEIVSTRLNAHSLFTVKTLAYLARGGRISKFNLVLGTAVDIKPIMHVNERGKLIAFNKVIGRRRSIMAIADNFVKNIINPETQTIFINHGDCIEDAELLAKIISNKVKVKEFIFNYLDPVIAIHSGPDTLAVYGYGVSRDPQKSPTNSIHLAGENI